MISMISASTATPQNRISTTELVASMMHKLSPELINTICSLGVENRYSAMDNYADFLTGASMNPTSSGSISDTLGSANGGSIPSRRMSSENCFISASTRSK